MGSSMKLTVIAEGVETEQQQVFLRAEGCDEGQGVFVQPPSFRRRFFRSLAPKLKRPRA